MIRERSNIIRRFGEGGFAQTDRVPSYGGGRFGQIVIQWLKNLIHSSSCSIYGICGGGVKTSYEGVEGRGWLKTSDYRHMGKGSKIAQKTVIL